MLNALRDSWWQNQPALLVSLFVIPIFMYDMLKTNHRIAGPLYRLKQEMMKLSESENGSVLGPLKFRDGDFWGELANEFNRVLSRVRCQDDRMKDYFERANESRPESISEEEMTIKFPVAG